ncbi:flagellar biosynthesis protein FlhB [uncultured Pseudoteredinibacter sp.]|uniref:flagellar biosynthesis protein FlhB n=1 Tax=uncultured Pseudoteredinibacter sp. TaxID=1641701 RepID=UPI00260D1D3C|nr:flagellar biosynthesis protein FlhB [uncultured Pseudoteredinibacter sp.]
MAEDSSQEKTEEPTPKRLEKAKEEGQVPRSRELTTSVLLLGGTICLFMLGGYITERMEAIMRFNLSLDRDVVFDTNLMFTQLGESIYDGLYILVPIFSVLALASIIGPISLGGWLFSAKSLAPKGSRMNPFSGLKRMFGVKGLMELLKSVGKVAVILVLLIVILLAQQEDILRLAYQDVNVALENSMVLSGIAAIILAASTILIAIIDVPFQIWDNSRKLKMSMQEIKDEMKDSEGKPEVKGRIRQLQREMAQNRMMSNVPEADVVITNPTHFACALKYDPNNMSTPILLAKGGDNIAFKIREIAKANGVEIIESPQLARAIFYTTEIDDEIPAGLYMAVAQVLAYVFGLRNFRRGQGEKPMFPKDVPIPPDMRYDK